MKSPALIAAALVLASATSAHAVQVVDLGAYTVSYDETTPGFGFMAYSFTSGGGSVGFAWSVSSSVLVTSLGPAAMASFTMPDFTITANPGYTLSGPVVGSIGNLVFNEVAGATTGASVAGVMLSVDNGPMFPFGSALTKVTTTSAPGFMAGYFADTATAPIAGFSSFGFSGGSLDLTASGGAFSSVISQPQNEFKISFVATPVPEPETVALFLAGLLTVGSLAYRRNRA